MTEPSQITADEAAQPNQRGHADGVASPFAQLSSRTFSTAKRHSSEFVGRFKKIDFKREVWPLDAASARRLSSEPTFWAVTLLAALPLFFTTFERPQYQMVAFAVYFAGIWGLIFRYGIVPNVRISLGWLSATLLFTGLIGVWALTHVVYPLMPSWFRHASDSQNPLVQFLGFIFQIGLCEEICKILPVAALMLIYRNRLRYGDIVMLGIFSGLGFAAFENLLYMNAVPDTVMNAIMTNRTDAAGVDPSSLPDVVHSILVNTSQASILVALSRTISCTFGHAVYSGIFAHFLVQGRGAGIKQVPLWIVGLVTAAVLHGMYDWLGGIQATLPVLSDVVSFMLLKLYIAQGASASAERQKALAPEVIAPV